MEKDKKRSINSVRVRRGRLLFFFFLFLFTCLGVRLFDLQLRQGSLLALKATRVNTRFLPAEECPRYEILDRQLRSLTGATTVPALIISPALISDLPTLVENLAQIFSLSPAEVNLCLSSHQTPFIFKMGIAPEICQVLNQKALPGAYILPVAVRYGPEALAAHLIGHLGSEDKTGKRVGVKGIEALYEENLARKPLNFWALTLDAQGTPVTAFGFQKISLPPPPEKNKGNVVLTLDQKIQEKVEETMERRIKKGAVVVLDLKTREVLALASRPNFNQREPGAFCQDEEGAFLNRALTPYPPGSLFKLVLAAAALEKGFSSPVESFFCSGKLRLPGGLTYSCWKEEGHGQIDLAQALAQSCNSVFIELGLRLGSKTIETYAAKLGLTQGELLGYPLPTWEAVKIGFGPGKIANASLGQEGVRLTPLQVANLMATIASGGAYLPPQVVKEIRTPTGEIVKKFPSPPPVQALEEETAKELQRMLILATREGTGQAAWLSPWGVAGKTGSAEAGKGRSHAWFAGYFPLEQPCYAVTVFIENGGSGGEVAAPVFQEIATALLED